MSAAVEVVAGKVERASIAVMCSAASGVDATPLTRYLRWQLSVGGTPSGVWDATFRISAPFTDASDAELGAPVITAPVETCTNILRVTGVVPNRRVAIEVAFKVKDTDPTTWGAGIAAIVRTSCAWGCGARR